MCACVCCLGECVQELVISYTLAVYVVYMLPPRLAGSMSSMQQYIDLDQDKHTHIKFNIPIKAESLFHLAGSSSQHAVEDVVVPFLL